MPSILLFLDSTLSVWCIVVGVVVVLVVLPGIIAQVGRILCAHNLMGITYLCTLLVVHWRLGDRTNPRSLPVTKTVSRRQSTWLHREPSAIQRGPDITRQWMPGTLNPGCSGDSGWTSCRLAVGRRCVRPTLPSKAEQSGGMRQFESDNWHFLWLARKTTSLCLTILGI